MSIERITDVRLALGFFILPISAFRTEKALEEHPTGVSVALHYQELPPITVIKFHSLDAQASRQKCRCRGRGAGLGPALNLNHVASRLEPQNFWSTDCPATTISSGPETGVATQQEGTGRLDEADTGEIPRLCLSDNSHGEAQGPIVT